MSPPRLFVLWLLFAVPASQVFAELPDAAKASVVQVTAYRADGRSALGSAVVVGPGWLVTNAHVTHGATRVEVTRGGATSVAKVAAHDAARDLCLLQTGSDEARLPAVRAAVTAGQKVYAMGFPAGRGFTVTEGQVIALHGYDGGDVIQVSAPFDYGASGGGLFDAQGRLVGILAFKARAGGLFHFALPVAWIEPTAHRTGMAHTPPTVPFWQREPERLPYFLRAVSFEATHNWSALASLAREWGRLEPANPGAWRALALAEARQRASADTSRASPAPVPPTGLAGTAAAVARR